MCCWYPRSRDAESRLLGNALYGLKISSSDVPEVVDVLAAMTAKIEEFASATDRKRIVWSAGHGLPCGTGSCSVQSSGASARAL
jgi:hypothetical protein